MDKISSLTKILGILKTTPRTGWIKKDIKTPESIAAHSYGVVLSSWLLCPKHLNKNHCMELAMVHDLAEAYCGDYTPDDPISAEEKHQKEEEGIDKISKELKAPELMTLFKEYEEAQTPEARFVHDIDKAETFLQALYYEEKEKIKLAQEFRETAQKKYLGGYGDRFIENIYKEK